MSKTLQLSWENRVYRGCTELDAKKLGIANYEEWRKGKLCFLECKDDKLRCSEKKLTVVRTVDLNQPKDYDRFIAARMGCKKQ